MHCLGSTVLQTLGNAIALLSGNEVSNIDLVMDEKKAGSVWWVKL